VIARVAVLSAAVAASLLATATAYACCVTSGLTMGTHNEPGPHAHFYGKLTSSRTFCQRHETVRLMQRRPGGRSFHIMRRRLTHDDGRWYAGAPGGGGIPNGTYFAKVGAHGPCPGLVTPLVTVVNGV